MTRDVLSQSEIDSLISALTSGDLSSKQQSSDIFADNKITPYDFRRPNKFSKDQIRTLKNVHENFARMLSNFLTAYLRVPAEVRLESISQVIYEEFIYSLPLPTLMTVFRMSGQLGIALFETNSFFTFPIIDLLFGGEGRLIRENRELTEIEISVLRKVNEKILNNLRYAWEDIVELQPIIDALDTNPQFSQLLPSNEAVALISFSTNIAGNEGLVNLCLPYITLEPVIAKLSVQNLHTRQAGSTREISDATKKLEKRLKSTEVELTAVLGQTSITVSDFLHFEAGDIILLDNPVDKPVDLCLEGKPRFKISLGALGNKVAAVVTDILLEEEDD